MRTLLADIEGNGLLRDCTKVHCVAYAEPGQEPTLTRDVPAALRAFDRADRVVFHNGIGYDVPVLQKLYGWEPQAEMVDSLVLCKATWSDRFERDARKKYAGFPTRFWGRHSLEAYGMRLGEHKGEYTGGWKEYNDEMGSYCRQDVRVLGSVWAALQRNPIPEQAASLEHDFARVIHAMNERGVAFNVGGGEDLQRELEIREAEIADELRAAFDDFTEVYFTPKRKERKEKTVTFNPGSRAHVARALIEQRGWKPTEFTDAGRPKLDESTLRGLDIPEAELVEEYLMLGKRLGQLSRGKAAWLKLVGDDDVIRPYVNHSGTVTFRCTHSGPNVSQVPATRAPWGQRCRELWQPRPGLVLVGSDAASVELRILAHYLAPYDGGRLCETLASGADPHQANADLAGISRDQAKTALYATLYGAGVAKLSKSLGVSMAEAKRIRQAFLDNLGVGRLIEAVKSKARRSGAVRALDGRHIPVRKLNSALNTLIQGNASILLKQWTVLAARELPPSAHLILHVHDEMQVECPPPLVTEVQQALESTLPLAGEMLGLRVPTPADSRQGTSWAETH